MNSIRLLDCTLREAPIDGLKWGGLSICKMIYGLSEAGVDIIECGFLKNVLYEEGSGLFSAPSQISEYIKVKKENTLYAAMVDYGRFDVDLLPQNDGSSIDLIRICFKKDEINEIISYAEKIKQKGYLISIQHVNTVAYSDQELIDFIGQVNVLKPYSYAIVDTFGSMYFDDVIRLTRLVDEHLNSDIILGLHTHNNLMLANANAESFVECLCGKRNIIIDSSLFGCGRGAGNANTELLAEYLNKKKEKNYDIDLMLDLIDTVINAAKKKAVWGYSIPNFIAGLCDAHSFNVKYLTQRHNIKSKDLRCIIEMLDENQRSKYDYALLDRLYVEYFNKSVDDEDEYDYLTKRLQGKAILLLAPGSSIIEERDTIDGFIRNNDPVVIGVNNYIDGIHCDYVFYSGIRRYELMKYRDVKRPTVLKTSNIKSQLYEDEIVFDYGKLIKFGWTFLDSSIVLLLRLLSRCDVRSVYIAGLDGYGPSGEAFYDQELETGLTYAERCQVTEENSSMLGDFLHENSGFDIHFITKSIYDEKLKGVGVEKI